MTVDPRFYRVANPVALAKLVGHVGLQTDMVPDISISGISAFEDATTGDLCFVDDVRLASRVAETCARGVVCVTTTEIAERAGGPVSVLIVPDPRSTFFALAEQLVPPSPDVAKAERPRARIHPDAQVHPTAIIGDGAAIGPRTEIGAYVCIGAGVQIGYDCMIGSAADIGFALIGNGVEIKSGARLGGAGFGLIPSEAGTKNTPHFGRLLVQDNVRIGANSCIDRGVLGDTVIGENSKIDNLCHIGHNTRVGRNVVMAAFAGISGSVDIGDDVVMGGRVGIVDHVSIGAGARLGADAAVFSSVPMGETWAGSPAKPLKQWQRETVWLKRETGKRSPD
ncbi:MAG: UDP-3-O-(3-hydroxymyristoyl)glucosamine N-acyltransferase [Hyphomonadaceae bacterium]